MSDTIDSKDFRRILGHYPTGVCAITAMMGAEPIGMVVGSFTAVSLDPPLVAFFPDRKSSTWPLIKASGRFCVNVLSELQQDVCGALSTKGPDKFSSVVFRHSNKGQPIIEGVVAWIECKLADIYEAGDHFIVVGKVEALDLEHSQSPLLFFKGGYGQYVPLPRLV